MIRRIGVMAGIMLPTNYPYVLVVVADPKPNEVVAVFECHRPVCSAHSRRPEASDVSESQGRSIPYKESVARYLDCGQHILDWSKD